MSNNNLNTETTNKIVQANKKNTLLFFKPWKFVLILFLILSSSLAYWWFTNDNLIKSYSDKVYPGAYILDKDLSGLNKDDLHNTIASLIEDISNKKVNVTAKEQTFEVLYKDLEATINYDDLENQIMSFGKDEDFFTKLSFLKKPENRKYEFEVLFNEENLSTFISSISNAINVEPVNASADISNNSINISNDSTGFKLNSDELFDNIKSQIKNMTAPNIIDVTGNVEVVEANITASALSNVNTKVSSFSTKYSVGPSGTNLQVATKNIDNVIVMPGETFSTEKAIGPTTIENGFVAANTYVGGKVVPGVGGGVCQVSSTLYNSILRAGILPSERLNHMMTVSYVPMGLDATLADDLIDLKFVNEFDFPIILNTYASNGNLTIELWSNDTVTNGITYEPIAIPVGPLSAETYLKGYNSNGELVIDKFIDKSTYQPFN